MSSRAQRLRLAADEVRDHGRDAFLCLTCPNVKDDGETYCPYCKSYWGDVANGLFDFPMYD